MWVKVYYMQQIKLQFNFQATDFENYQLTERNGFHIYQTSDDEILRCL